MEIKIKKLTETAKIPEYKNEGDAGMDLYADEVTYIQDLSGKVEVNFNIAVEIPEGYVGLIFPRSSIHKQYMILSNAVGVVDSGYRGALKAVFYGNYLYQQGDRVAQLIVMPYPKVTFIEVEELSTTERGEGGFGSTGK